MLGACVARGREITSRKALEFRRLTLVPRLKTYLKSHTTFIDCRGSACLGKDCFCMSLMHSRRPFTAAIIASALSVGLIPGSPLARAEAPSHTTASQSQSAVTVDATTEPLVSSKLAFPNL